MKSKDTRLRRWRIESLDPDDRRILFLFGDSLRDAVEKYAADHAFLFDPQYKVEIKPDWDCQVIEITYYYPPRIDGTQNDPEIKLFAYKPVS